MDDVVCNRLPERCRDCSLRGAALCGAVAASKLPGVRTPKLRRFRRDETIAGEGQPPDFMGVLRSGFVRREKLRPDGRRTVIGLACPGDQVGWWSQSLPAHTLEAATDVEICIFDARTVSRMMNQDSRFQWHVMQEAYFRHERQLEMIWLRGALTSRERIIAFLVRAAEVMPAETLPDGSVIVTVELSRRDWADLSNTTVESISRTLGYLAEKDLVTTVAPARYRIRDLSLLSRLAGIGPEHEHTRLTLRNARTDLPDRPQKPGGRRERRPSAAPTAAQPVPALMHAECGIGDTA